MFAFSINKYEINLFIKSNYSEIKYILRQITSNSDVFFQIKDSAKFYLTLQQN